MLLGLSCITTMVLNFVLSSLFLRYHNHAFPFQLLLSLFYFLQVSICTGILTNIVNFMVVMQTLDLMDLCEQAGSAA